MVLLKFSYLIAIYLVSVDCGPVKKYSEKNEVIKRVPDYLKVCRSSDPNLNACIKTSIEILKPKLKDGITELMIPPCDPLVVPKISIKQNSGAINMDSEYSDIKVSGLSNFDLLGVRVDPNKNKIRIKFWFSELKMSANYKIQGKLLMMPLMGNGTCTADVDATASMKAERYTKHNQDYLKVKELFIDFNIGGATVHLKDLFNGDRELGIAMNRFLNENWKSVAAEMRPALEDAIGGILKDITDRVFQSYTIQQLMPE